MEADTSANPARGTLPFDERDAFLSYTQDHCSQREILFMWLTRQAQHVRRSGEPIRECIVLFRL